MSEALWLTEADVVALINLPAATQCVRAVLALEVQGRAETMEKTSITWGDGDTLHAIGGVAGDIVGTKTWAHTGGGATPLLVLWDAATGRLRAIIEAFALGQLRTAAVSALATDLLADPGAESMAVIGSGKQAYAQVAAVASVRRLESLRVHSPTAAHRDALADRLRATGAAPSVEVFDSVAGAVAGASVVTTVTRARDPFLHSAMLAPGAHVNAIGAITPERVELAEDVASDAALVVSDSPDAAGRLSRELAGASTVWPLSAVVTGAAAAGDGSTVFKAMGIGLADVALGSSVLAAAIVGGRGRPVPAPQKAVPSFFGGIGGMA